MINNVEKGTIAIAIFTITCSILRIAFMNLKENTILIYIKSIVK